MNSKLQDEIERLMNKFRAQKKAVSWTSYQEQALFGGIKKAVKKVTKGVKKLASSDMVKLH